MTPEAPPLSEPTPAGMSEVARIGGVFLEPAKTFEDIAARPRWLVPLLLVMLSSIAMMAVFSQRIGWDTVVRERLQNNPQIEQMPADQRERAIAMGTKMGAISAFAGVVIFLPVANLLIAAILLGIAAGILSAKVKYKQVFAVVCYSGLPTMVSAALAIVVMFLKKPEEFNLRNPLVFNPAAFMDPLSTSKFVYSLASSLDLFSIWVILLIATGLKAAGGKQLSFGGALFAVVLPWALYVLCKSAMAGAFG